MNNEIQHYNTINRDRGYNSICSFISFIPRLPTAYAYEGHPHDHSLVVYCVEVDIIYYKQK